RDDKPYTVIDTAGVRRRKNINEAVEKFSILKTLQAISDAHVTILLVDAREGLVDQDLHMLSHVVNAGRALVIAVNKWDGLEDEYKTAFKADLERKLVFNDFAEVHYISALHGSGVGKLYKSVDIAYEAATRELSTNRLTTILEQAVFNHPPPMINGRRIKLRYAHAGGRNPPIIVIHGNQTQSVPKHYIRYLEKTYRRQLSLYGTPIKLEFRTADNPYSGKKNTLSQRQINKKRRMMRHVKKKKR
ncbi:ribosome biogenesis GTPase Der, partial [bacterium]|nr:ribosome biogenesis GTPase Der [bacterium]